MSETDIDPDRLRQAAGGVTSATEELQGHFSRHAQAMADMQSICGDDDLGSLIFACYQAIHEVAFGSFNDNNVELGSRAQTIQTMADNYTTTEDANVVDVNQVARYL